MMIRFDELNTLMLLMQKRKKDSFFLLRVIQINC